MPTMHIFRGGGTLGGEIEGDAGGCNPDARSVLPGTLLVATGPP